jgi:hypothetical protein
MLIITSIETTAIVVFRAIQVKQPKLFFFFSTYWRVGSNNNKL